MFLSSLATFRMQISGCNFLPSGKLDKRERQPSSMLCSPTVKVEKSSSERKSQSNSAAAKFVLSVAAAAKLQNQSGITGIICRGVEGSFLQLTYVPLKISVKKREELFWESLFFLPQCLMTSTTIEKKVQISQIRHNAILPDFLNHKKNITLHKGLFLTLFCR